MDEMMLLDILKLNYGIDSHSLEFLREGGSHTYIVNGKIKYLLKVIGSAFSDTKPSFAETQIRFLKHFSRCHTKSLLINSYPHTVGFSAPSGSRLCV